MEDRQRRQILGAVCSIEPIARAAYQKLDTSPDEPCVARTFEGSFAPRVEVKACLIGSGGRAARHLPMGREP